jgi:DNA polymerase
LLLTPVFVDFETFWSVAHSLTKMNPIAYVMHPDTELISVAVKVGPAPTDVIFGEENIKAHLRSIDWSDKFVIGHNMSGFDAMILAWRCGVKPKMWGCTLAMARPTAEYLTVGGSLGALVAAFNIGVKDDTVLNKTKGKHLIDFTAEEVEEMREYNASDTDNCCKLFHHLRFYAKKSEMRLIDLTVRMLVDPKFDTDRALLTTTLIGLKARQRDSLIHLAGEMGLLKDAGLDHIVGHPNEAELVEVTNQLTGGIDAIAEQVRAELASAPKFAALLKRLGVEPPTKTSPTTGKLTYAFSRTDQEYVEMQDHQNPIVAAAVATRLQVKSTILESRIKSFLEVANVMRGKMPIAKNYYAAHTGRWGGSMGLNQENLPRIPRDKDDAVIEVPSNALRFSLRAPPGYKVVVSDLSGIELRVNHFLWKVPYSTALWTANPKADLYRAAGAIEYGCAPEAITKDQRQLEKVKALGLGFGAGPATFKGVARLMGGIVLTDSQSESAVKAWRGKHPEIVQGWRRCHNALTAIHQGSRFEIDPWGMCYTSAEGIHTPVGMIRYPGLHQEMCDGNVEWWYGQGRNRARIYAGKVTENIVQHLARFILSEAMLRIDKHLPVRHAVHDEIITIPREEQAGLALTFMEHEMRKPPEWWPELVVRSVGDIADTYGEAK